MKLLKQSRWTTVTQALAWAWMVMVLLAATPSAQAQSQVVGTVTNLSGLLTARHADGTRTVLAVKSSIQQGDTLITERETYTRVKFIDNAEIVLRPGSEVVVAKYVYDEKKPESDSVAIGLVKGGLRAVTGLVGKRNHDAVSFDTPTATIGIRGTTFIAQYCQNNCSGAPPASGAGPSPAPSPLPGGALAPPPVPSAPAASMQPGLYVTVLDGAIQLTNRGGSQLFQAGQFGFTPNANTPPVILPQNPGLKFSPPPVFNTSTPTASGGSGKAAAVDCEVR